MAEQNSDEQSPDEALKAAKDRRVAAKKNLRDLIPRHRYKNVSPKRWLVMEAGSLRYLASSDSTRVARILKISLLITKK